jgi:hypothetical protein
MVMYRQPLFCKNSLSYKKNKKMKSSVHVQLHSMCTDDCQLMNQLTSATGKRTEFPDHGGRAISMVSKNWKLFVARLSNFLLGEMLLGRPEKENVSRQKKWRELMGQTPYHHSQRTCIRTSGTYRKKQCKMPSIFRLRSITRRCNRHLPSK